MPKPRLTQKPKPKTTKKSLNNQEKGRGLETPALPENLTPSKAQRKYQDTAAKLRDIELVKSKMHMQRKMQVSYDGSDPDLIAFYLKFRSALERHGYAFYAHCLVRSNEEQYRLWRAGRSKARPGLSAHNHGMAVDVVHSVRHWDLNVYEWGLIGTIGKETARKMNIKVNWGGDWGANWDASPPQRGWDPAHWELADWKQRAQLS